MRARSSVRLERPAHNGFVAGSNPAAPTGQKTEPLFSPFWTAFWSIVLAWCMTWPIEGTLGHSETAHLVDGLIAIVGWPVVSFLVWRTMRDR